MNLRGVFDPAHLDRETVDLLFFPTGGGKTEAYLGLAAFTMVLRRLRHPGSREPMNELAQTLTYTIVNPNQSLFLTQPSLKANGDLVFKPKAGANGTVVLQITLKDSGGTLNGGQNTFGSVPLTIAIRP